MRRSRSSWLGLGLGLGLGVRVRVLTLTLTLTPNPNPNLNQIADSEAITSTVLLRELHAQAHAAALKAGGRGLPPLNIVTQVVDVLTQRLLHAEPHLLEPKAVETDERRSEPPKVESI